MQLKGLCATKKADSSPVTLGRAGAVKDCPLRRAHGSCLKHAFLLFSSNHTKSLSLPFLKKNHKSDNCFLRDLFIYLCLLSCVCGGGHGGESVCVEARRECPVSLSHPIFSFEAGSFLEPRAYFLG